MLPKHLFVSSGDGALYDTRAADWSKAAPLRATYSRHVAEIKTAADFKACLRAGAHAWPGGYPLYFVTHSGAAFSFDAAKSEAREIILALLSGDKQSDWLVVALETNFEDSDLICDHSGKPIESAYGEESES
ncbi:hypothetical protein [Mesorhizobium sp. INR15]|uniref:hypothetical protein n=1 Tax=Mesorhizobium sp. INR15 TaxID=2654248 RepID=UPI00189686E4|nr:hypothetical protein [Mesorhizobium sp. INR15]QPC91486.1 hypothetical protein GA829_13175 [Mesorhizobium sp. INR15]